MKENKKKILIIGILLICAIVVYKIPRLLINKNNEPLPEVKLKETNNKKSFAIMIQNENGYEEYNKDTWPTEGYKFKEAKCIDNNGSKVDNAITYNNGKVTLTTNQTIYCTLYFDKKLGISALDIVASKPKSLSPKPDQGDMYRYQGTSDLVNDNYICFGTKEKSECTNDEDHYMYRIIGITPEGEMKLIKQTPVVEEGNTIFSWYHATGTNDSGNALYGTVESGLETWPESAIYKRLNGLSNGITTGDGENNSSSLNKNINADTNIYVDSYTNEYPYMKRTSDWYKKIADHDWMYGSSSEGFNFNGHEMYKAETGQIPTKYYYLDKEKGHYVEGTYKWNTETDKVTAKIGLPYVHDIYLAYYDGETEKTRGIPGGSSFEYWIGSLILDYRMAPMTSCPDANAASPPQSTYAVVRTINSSGEDGKCSAMDITAHYKGYRMYPTFYLPNTIEMEGTGIETDPYRIVN